MLNGAGAFSLRIRDVSRHVETSNVGSSHRILNWKARAQRSVIKLQQPTVLYPREREREAQPVSCHYRCSSTYPRTNYSVSWSRKAPHPVVKGTLFASKLNIGCQLITVDKVMSPNLCKRGDAPPAHGTV